MLLMKYILFLLLLPFTGFAQGDTSQLVFEHKADIKGTSARRIYMDAITYGVKHSNAFYIANKEAAVNCPMLKRSSMGESKKKALLGLTKSKQNGYIVMASGLCVYETTEENACIKILAVSCDILIQCNKGSADIRISNLRYYHFGKSKPATMVPIEAAGKTAELKGRYEDLLNSGICADELKDIDTFVRGAMNTLLGRISTGVGGDIKSVDW